jgi:choice-of-anchor A domain-containing protein
VTWPALRPGPAGDVSDGRVSVLVGGDLSVSGSAAGAEGIVVAAGDATFARDEPGAYRVGVTGLGSQVTPHADSDMLVVGGSLAATPGTPLEVGPGLDGDAVVGGGVADGTSVALGDGRLDSAVADATAPYQELLAGLGAKSGAYAGLPVTGTVDVTGTAVTLTGDGVSDPQVFAVDGATLGSPGESPHGRSLQLLGVPDGASAIVNLTGPVVELDVDTLLGPGGAPVDASADPYFAHLATHLLWNVPGASTVDLGGAAQLPGSLLVGSAPSTTTIDLAGTNGRVHVAGDLVHAAGELHSYPFLGDPALSCGPDLEHVGTLTLDVVLKDPAGVVDKERSFEGTFSCFLDGQDVTPGDGTWQLRAQAEDRILSDRVPVDALCFVKEQLEWAPALGWDWRLPDIAPAKVTVAKRDPRGFTVTNSLQPIKTPPTPGEDEPTPTPEPTAEPTSTPAPDPIPTEPVDPTPTPVEPEPSPTDEPVEVPEEVLPSALPTPEPTPPASDPDDDSVEVVAEPPARPNGPGPLTTTAPYTLRGAFVWAPLLLLSVLALRMRFPWRYKRYRRLH